MLRSRIEELCVPRICRFDRGLGSCSPFRLERMCGIRSIVRSPGPQIVRDCAGPESSIPVSANLFRAQPISRARIDRWFDRFESNRNRHSLRSFRFRSDSTRSTWLNISSRCFAVISPSQIFLSLPLLLVVLARPSLCGDEFGPNRVARAQVPWSLA